MVSASKLPLELVDYSIDFLSDDAAALKSCSAVCRAWSAAARYHLFETFAIESVDVLDSLAGSGLPFAHIKILTIEADNIARELLVFPHWPLFANVIELCLFNLVSHGDPDLDAMVRSLFQNFPLVQTLKIGRGKFGYRASQFHSLQTLVRSICSLPSLQHLSMDDYVEWEVIESHDSEPFAHETFPLRTLYLHGFREDWKDFVQCLVECCGTLGLWRFSLGTYNGYEHSFRQLVMSSLPTLRHLDLDAGPYNSSWMFNTFFRLSLIIIINRA